MVEKYLIRFSDSRMANYFMWEVKRKTAHWAIPPKVRKHDRTIEFGNVLIYLATDHKHEVGRHDHIKISAASVLYAINMMNTRIRVDHQGIFNK